MVDRGEQDISWDHLPQHILVSVFSYLTPHERLQAALSCKSWLTCLQHPLLWRRFVCRFIQPANDKLLQPIENHGHRIRALVVELDQEKADNRMNACKILHSLAGNLQRKLTSLTVRFLGQNPLFYAGHEFVTELKLLFSSASLPAVPHFLTDIDLSGLDVALDDTLFDVLAENQPQLESLNIQNKSIICKVSPVCMLRLVSQCRKLKDLRVFHISLSDEVLLALARPDEPCLRRLSIVFRREAKYTEDLSSEAWLALVNKIPKLSVMLGFDHTCPLHRISELMKAEIPVTVLRLETFTHIADELNQATTFYHKTLEEVVLQTRNSEELSRALIRLAEECSRLRTLLVYCVLSQSVVEMILNLHPEMKRKGSYILKYQMEEGPWVVGAETDEEVRDRLRTSMN